MLKVGRHRSITISKGYIVEDKRKTFLFLLPDGRKAETKALTVEEARNRVESILALTVKEAV